MKANKIVAMIMNTHAHKNAGDVVPREPFTKATMCVFGLKYSSSVQLKSKSRVGKMRSGLHLMLNQRTNEPATGYQCHLESPYRGQEITTIH